MNFNSIENLTEEEIVNLFDSTVEGDDTVSQTSYMMHTMCTDGTVYPNGYACTGGHYSSPCPKYYVFLNRCTAYEYQVWGNICIAKGKTGWAWCCE